MIFWKDRDFGMRVSSSTKSRQMQGRTEGGRPGPQPHPAERWAPGPAQISPQVQPKDRPKARWLGVSPWSSLTCEAVLASQTCSDPMPGRVSPGVGSAQSGVVAISVVCGGPLPLWQSSWGVGGWAVVQRGRELPV